MPRDGHFTYSNNDKYRDHSASGRFNFVFNIILYFVVELVASEYLLIE